MIKKTALFMAIVLAAVSLSGCWSYWSLSDMSIVTAMAIDIDDNGGYDLTFETADLSGPVRQEGIKAYLVKSQGPTIFYAIRNAINENVNRFYFGHLQAVILSEDAARSRDITGIIDWFLRDEEPRETTFFVISEGKARDFISTKPYGNPLLGVEIHKIMDNDRSVTLSLPYVELYNIYNIINGEGESLALPFFHIENNAGQPAIAANGTAVYKGQRMEGTLSVEETKYLLFIEDKAESGLLTFPASGEGPDDTTLEISKTDTQTQFTYKSGKLEFDIKTDTDVFLGQYSQSTGEIDDDKINTLEATASACLKQGIEGLIKKMQTEYDSDIFGFGNMIYKQKPALWDKLSANWDETFASLDVEVECKINIVNTASIKE